MTPQNVLVPLGMSEMNVRIPAKGMQASQQLMQHTAHAEHIRCTAHQILPGVVEVLQTFWTGEA